jgi:P-type Cu+ transporter
MAMSSVSVVTNALRLRGFRRPQTARAILHPSLRERVGEYAYLVTIALIALAVGALALAYAPKDEMGAGSMGAMTERPVTSAAAAGVGVQLVTPAAVQSGTPVPLVYRLTDARTGVPLTDLVSDGGEWMHLIVVSQDLGQFQHVHPQPSGRAGEYVIDVAFPTAGSYLLYSEFSRASQEVVQRDAIRVGAGSTVPPPLAEDRAPKVVGDVRVALQGIGTVVAGQDAALVFRLEEAATGEGLRDLQSYLGEPAHAVILSEDAATFAHLHGEQVDAADGAHEASGSGFGPEIKVHYTFPAPGLYKVWGQFKTRTGEVITAPFVIRAQ